MISTQLVGRKAEQELLLEALQSPEPEMIAVLGRRRVGKTFLIRSVYKGKIDFAVVGIKNASLAEQLQNFNYELSDHMGLVAPMQDPKNWLEAFYRLIQFLKKQGRRDRKYVLFFDELPWLATHKSGFLKALGYFWNSWASMQPVVVVICGSAASWMIQKVVNHKGGLHNRITKRIFLKPFTLAETEAYFKSKNIHFNRYQIVQLYMAMGGIPHYLKEVKGGRSATQNIERLCFSDVGFLKEEFFRLYPALFEKADNHMNIVRALAKKQKGLTRQEIVQLAKVPNGGGLSKTLEELIQSGFVTQYYPFGKKKRDLLYRLSDEYSLFYLKFIENKRYEESSIWQKLSQTQAYKIWCGYAFENICLKHLPQIKKALGISGMYTLSSSFYKKGTANEKGIQIDLLIDRQDQVINLFEIKFYNELFTLKKEGSATNVHFLVYPVFVVALNYNGKRNIL